MPKPKRLKKVLAANKGQQYAAIPIRLNEASVIEVLLLTSRGTGRWVIPKGWPMRNLAPGAAAAREAYEEAGVRGRIRPRAPVGSYHYQKNLGVDEVPVKVLVKVEVFLLWADRQLETWPEQAERETRWFTPEEAACLVAEPELAALLLNTRNIVTHANG